MGVERPIYTDHDDLTSDPAYGELPEVEMCYTLWPYIPYVLSLAGDSTLPDPDKMRILYLKKSIYL